MAVTKTCKPDAPAEAGTSAFCDIGVANLGVSDAQNVVVTDAIVSNASFTVTSVTAAAASCTTSIGSPTSATVTCNLHTVIAGGGTAIHVAFTSNDPADINDMATVRSTTPDPVSGNNSATGRMSFFASADLCDQQNSDAAQSSRCWNQRQVYHRREQRRTIFGQQRGGEGHPPRRGQGVGCCAQCGIVHLGYTREPAATAHLHNWLNGQRAFRDHYCRSQGRSERSEREGS